jgi:LuxR family maltose regulon positive regulatory protein
MLDDQGIASLSLAHIAYEKNDLDEAEQLARRALELSQRRANEMLEVQASIRLACIDAARGNLSRAPELLKILEGKIQNTALLREIQATQALLSIRANDSSGLDWWVRMISAENQSILPLKFENEAFVLARLRISKNKAEEAITLLKKWHEDAVQNGRVRSQIEALCLEALAYSADSDLSNSVQALAEALSLGQAKGFRRAFLDEGMRMAALLQSILPTLQNRSISLFASTLLHAFLPEVTSSLVAPGSTVQIEPLSPQELRVLRFLVAGLSNADIAQELVVSTNTIKTHVKSIYRKLNVNSRDEARAVARELKLL